MFMANQNKAFYISPLIKLLVRKVLAMNGGGGVGGWFFEQNKFKSEHKCQAKAKWTFLHNIQYSGLYEARCLL